MQSASPGVSGVAATGRPAARAACVAAGQQAHVAHTGLRQVERGERRDPGLVGDRAPPVWPGSATRAAIRGRIDHTAPSMCSLR